MDEEDAGQGMPPEDQNHDAERPVAGDPPEGGARPDQAEPAQAAPPPTGDERVDRAIAGLSRLPGTPVDGHVAVLEEVHGRLRDILGELADPPGASETSVAPVIPVAPATPAEEHRRP
jgi:hypothetical protein